AGAGRAVPADSSAVSPHRSGGRLTGLTGTLNLPARSTTPPGPYGRRGCPHLWENGQVPHPHAAAGAPRFRNGPARSGRVQPRIASGVKGLRPPFATAGSH